MAPDAKTEYITNDEGRGQLVFNEGREVGKEENGMIILKKVGNTIHNSIQVKTDYPSLHTDNKLPLLDIKMWIEDLKDMNGNPTKEVLHEFYSKDVSSKAVIHAKSAMPTSNKRTALTQEILRILLRCSPSLPWENTLGHIHTFLQRMQFSAYPVLFRAQVLDSALKAYDKIKEQNDKKITPM